MGLICSTDIFYLASYGVLKIPWISCQHLKIGVFHPNIRLSIAPCISVILSTWCVYSLPSLPPTQPPNPAIHQTLSTLSSEYPSSQSLFLMPKVFSLSLPSLSLAYNNRLLLFFFFFLPSVSSHSNEMIVFSHTTLFFLMFFIRFRTSLRSWHRQRDSDVRCGYYLIAELLLLLCLSCSLIPGLSNLQFQILRECLALSILGYSPYFLCLYHSYFCLFPIISYRNSSP